MHSPVELIIPSDYVEIHLNYSLLPLRSEKGDQVWNQKMFFDVLHCWNRLQHKMIDFMQSKTSQQKKSLQCKEFSYLGSYHQMTSKGSCFPF